MKYTKRHFENLARETRADAVEATDANAKHLLLAIADAYDRMAELVKKAKGVTG
jgi:hypothetical protein